MHRCPKTTHARFFAMGFLFQTLQQCHLIHKPVVGNGMTRLIARHMSMVRRCRQRHIATFERAHTRHRPLERSQTQITAVSQRLPRATDDPHTKAPPCLILHIFERAILPIESLAVVILKKQIGIIPPASRLLQCRRCRLQRQIIAEK